MFTISSGLEFWSVNNTSVYKNSQLKNFKIIDFFPVKHAVILPSVLLGRNRYKILKTCWWSLLTILQWTNTTSVICKWDTFSPVLSLIILFLVLPSNFIISGFNPNKADFLRVVFSKAGINLTPLPHPPTPSYFKKY